MIKKHEINEAQLILRFLGELAHNNTREWLSEHEPEYRQVMKARDNIALQFIGAIARVEPAAAMLSPKECTYRLMRDTRFSNDKTPYKTYIGIFVCPPLGKKSLLSGYYLHIEPGRSVICGGNYGLPTKMVNVVRSEIRANIDEYISIVEDPEFKKFFPKIGEEWLKTAPKGFDRDWEYIDYVRPKDFGVSMHLEDAFFENDNFIETMMPQIEQIARLNRFVNFSITESGLPLMRETGR